MHIHGSSVPFNIRSYPTSKSVSDSTSNSAVFALPSSAIAAVYNPATTQDQSSSDDSESAQSSAADDSSGSSASIYSLPATVSSNYNSSASLTSYSSSVGSLIDSLA